MRLGSRIKEGYKALISVEEVCISRVAAMVTVNIDEWNVANCRVTDCRRGEQKKCGCLGRI